MKRIALIEDMKEFREFIKEELVRRGFHVDGFETCEAFLNRGENYDIVVTDNNLGTGNMKGLEMTQEFRKRDQNTVVFMFSSDEIEEEFKTVGGTIYFNKSRIKDLIKTVEGICQ